LPVAKQLEPDSGELQNFPPKLNVFSIPVIPVTTVFLLNYFDAIFCFRFLEKSAPSGTKQLGAPNRKKQ
jgi:hypothetical protein